MLDAIRIDNPSPTVNSRIMYHVSAAMYDAWAAYDKDARAVYRDEYAAAYAPDLDAARNEAVSFAAYRVLSGRFTSTNSLVDAQDYFDGLMNTLGYDIHDTSTLGHSPASIGNRIGQKILATTLNDGSLESNNYNDFTYAASNPPMLPYSEFLGIVPGTNLVNKNRWQPLIIDFKPQRFLTPQWRNVTPFALPTKTAPGEVYHDPGPPPQLGDPATDAEFKSSVLELIYYNSLLDPTPSPKGPGETAAPAMIDISPGQVGNNTLGTQDGTGHAVNPATGLPYAPNVVNQADWGRLLAEFWADGPDSETPPGHWNTIANEVMSHPAFTGKIAGKGDVVDPLEYEVKLYLALNGALHDAAIAAWDTKRAYDYVRPISMIRYMGGLGQSSDPSGPAYHPEGLPLQPGLVEVVTAESVASGRHAGMDAHIGEVVVWAWLQYAPDGVTEPNGVGWVRAVEWLPYQAFDFITPAFPAYVSGHSAFSRAAAEVLAAFTGDAYFPGGLGEFHIPADWLEFEPGTDDPITLQWATYFDASDEAGLSRLYGGIHVRADDFSGRMIGHEVGLDAFNYASRLFVPTPNAAMGGLLMGGLALRRRR